mgnify:CR=1 FL=1
MAPSPDDIDAAKNDAEESEDGLPAPPSTDDMPAHLAAAAGDEHRAHHGGQNGCGDNGGGGQTTLQAAEDLVDHIKQLFDQPGGRQRERIPGEQGVGELVRRPERTERDHRPDPPDDARRRPRRNSRGWRRTSRDWPV